MVSYFLGLVGSHRWYHGSLTSPSGTGHVSGCATNANIRFGDFELPDHALLGVSQIDKVIKGQSAIMRRAQARDTVLKYLD